LHGSTHEVAITADAQDLAFSARWPLCDETYSRSLSMMLAHILIRDAMSARLG
jgi:hypothetical protein